MGKVLGKILLLYRWWVIVLTLLLVSLAGSGIRNLQFNDDTRVWFGKDNPQLLAFEELEHTYTKSDNVYIAVEPKNGDVFTQTTLAAIEDITRRGWQVPHSNRVDSITNFQYTHADNDLFIVNDLVENAFSLTKDDLGRIRRIALSEPSLVDRLLSPNGDVAAININILRPAKSTDELARISTYSEKMVVELRQLYPGINFYLSGGIIFDDAFVDATRGDINALIPVMLILMVLISTILLRSVFGAIVIFLVISLSTVVAMGLAGYFGIYLNPASGTAPVVILTLAIADSIHILITMFNKIRHGDTRHDAIIYSMTKNLRPVFITSTTTVIGFLTMNFSDAPPFHDLGNIVALGVTAAFILSVTFLPAMMSVLPLGNVKDHGIDNLTYQYFANVIFANKRPILWSTLGAGIICSTGIAQIELDDNFIQYLDERFDVRRASDFIQDRLTGFDYIDYSLKAGESDGINSPDYLATLESFAQWYRQQPGVVHVNTFTDIVKQLNKNMHNDEPDQYRLPTRQDLSAQYLLLYEMSLPYGLDLNNRINVDKSATRFSVILKYRSSKQLRETDERARQWLKANAPPAMFTHGSGLSIMFAHISKRNIDSMLLASLLALLLISLSLMIAFRSFKIGLISLAPNILPAFMMFGIWGIVVGQVGLAAAVVVTLTLGIVVDDTVHFLSNYLHARRFHKMDAYNGVRYALSSVGTALWSTTVILVVGFSVLIFSGYKVNSEMGLLTMITISLALILDFVFLPVLLILTDNK